MLFELPKEFVLNKILNNTRIVRIRILFGVLHFRIFILGILVSFKKYETR